ncbi:MAG: hypothetical protein V3T61_10860, partial [Acidobacteriota bacterium]
WWRWDGLICGGENSILMVSWCSVIICCSFAFWAVQVAFARLVPNGETDLEKAELNGYNYLMISELIVLTRVLVPTAGELILSTMVDIFLPGLPTCTLTERLP